MMKMMMMLLKQSRICQIRKRYFCSDKSPKIIDANKKLIKKLDTKY